MLFNDIFFVDNELEQISLQSNGISRYKVDEIISNSRASRCSICSYVHVADLGTIQPPEVGRSGNNENLV